MLMATKSARLDWFSVSKYQVQLPIFYDTSNIKKIMIHTQKMEEYLIAFLLSGMWIG